MADHNVQLRTKQRNKRPGLDNLDTNSLARPSSGHHGAANGVHKRDRDSSANRHSKGPHDVPDADTRSVASGTSNRPKHKGPPAHGYRKKEGGKKDGGKKDDSKRKTKAEESRPIEMNNIKTNGEVAATPSGGAAAAKVTMRTNRRKSGLATKMKSYGGVSFRKSGYNVWTESGKQRASVKFTRELHEKKGKKKWLELRHVTDLTIDDEDEVFATVPPQLCDLTDLKSLCFTLSGATSLPASFAQLHLRHLTLRENKFHNVDAVAKMTLLTTLDLSFNELRTLPAQIGALTRLMTLNVGKNKLESLPASIGDLKELRELSVNANKLAKLPQSIGSLRHLTSLDIGDNHLSSLPDTIGKLEAVTELRASHNKLSTLPASIEDMRSLQYLFLGRNEFTAVPPILEKMKSLRVVNMNQNRVADMTCPLRSIHSLMLDGNQLEQIPAAIFACEALVILSLQRNRIRVIPDDIQRLRNLHSLLLEENELSEVPEAVTRLSDLNHLALNSTNVQRLPKSFKSLNRLTNLTLNKSKLDKALQEAYSTEGLAGVMGYVGSQDGEAQSAKL